MRNNPILNTDMVNASIPLWIDIDHRSLVPEQTMEYYIAFKRSGKLVVALQYPYHGDSPGIGKEVR